MCFFVLSSIIGLELKISIGQTPLDTNFGFSIGGEIGLMVVAVMMAISILPTYKRQSPYIRVFFTLLAAGTLVLYLDAIQMIVDGEPALAVFNKILSVSVFSFETIFMFFFWLYSSYMLKCNSKATDFISYLLSGLCLLFVLLPWLISSILFIFVSMKPGFTTATSIPGGFAVSSWWPWSLGL